MDPILEILTTRGEHLLGRLIGPLHFRLIIMPVVVSTLAILAGLRDAREGRPGFLLTLLTNPAERQRALSSALADIGRIFIVALVLDTAYQLTVLRAFYAGELLLVAVACAIVPYVAVRGPVTFITRGLLRSRPIPIISSPAKPTENTKGRSEY